MTRPPQALRSERPRTRHAALWLCLVLQLMAAATALQPAAAQSDADATRAASARAFFEEGVRLAEQGDWTDAEDRFRRALALRTSPVIAYNLASTLAERGKLVEASEMLRRVLADGNLEPGLKASAARQLSDLAARIAHLAVDVRGWQAGDGVLLDGTRLLDAQLRIEIPVDPGSHQLRLERSGATVAVYGVELAPGASRRVTLEARTLAPTPQSVAPSAEPEPAQPLTAANAAVDDGGGVWTRWWFWTGAAAVVGAGVVIGVLAASGSGGQSERPYQGNVPPGSIQVEVNR